MYDILVIYIEAYSKNQRIVLTGWSRGFFIFFCFIFFIFFIFIFIFIKYSLLRYKKLHGALAMAETKP